MFKEVVLPIQSVGVQGDNRTYRHPLLLIGKFTSWKKLGKLSTELTNKRSDINRVLYLVGGDLKSDNINFQLVSGFLTKNRISLLQDIDEIVERFQVSNGLLKKIWQFPVVLIPVSTDGKKESIVLRPIESQDAMTANFYKMNFDLLNILVNEMLDNHGDKIECVFYDITNKPPGTIEWE